MVGYHRRRRSANQGARVMNARTFLASALTLALITAVGLAMWYELESSKTLVGALIGASGMALRDFFSGTDPNNGRK